MPDLRLLFTYLVGSFSNRRPYFLRKIAQTWAGAARFDKSCTNNKADQPDAWSARNHPREYLLKQEKLNIIKILQERAVFDYCRSGKTV